MKMKVKQVIDLLEANGWLYIGTKGDHHKFYKSCARRPIIIAGKRNDNLAEGTLLSILREAGLKEPRKQNELNEDNHAHIDSNH